MAKPRYIAKKFIDKNGNVEWMVIDTTTNKAVSNERIRQSHFQAPRERYDRKRIGGKSVIVEKGTGRVVPAAEWHQLIRDNKEIAKASERIQREKYGIKATIGKISRPVGNALQDLLKIGRLTDESANLPYSERGKRRTILGLRREHLNYMRKLDEEDEKDEFTPTKEQRVRIEQNMASRPDPIPTIDNKGDKLEIKPQALSYVRATDEWIKNPTVPKSLEESSSQPIERWSSVFTIDPRTGKPLGVVTRNQRKNFEQFYKSNENLRKIIRESPKPRNRGALKVPYIPQPIEG